MNQPGSIKRVIEAVGLDNGMTSGKYMPVEASQWVKYKAGKSVIVTFRYISVVGMILYSDDHTSTDTAYALH